jgi:hypothetical protein
MSEDFDFSKAGDYRFGVCPVCQQTDGYANAGKTHVLFCKEHKKSWYVGSNLFSSWKYQTEEEQRKYWEETGLDSFERVEPYMGPPGYWEAFNNQCPGAVIVSHADLASENEESNAISARDMKRVKKSE